MGILSAALAAAGDAGVQSINQNIQQQNQLDQMNQQAQLQAQNDASRSNLELQKQQSLLDYQNDLKNEPLDRYAELAKQKSDEQVPIEPAPFTGLNQTSADNSILADGNTPMQSGLQGNVAQINSLEKKAQITLSNPQATDEQKQNAQGILDQLKTQYEAQKQASLDDVQGQTRSRTPDEAIDAALTDLKISDPQAYAAAMASGVMPSKYTKVGENETLIDAKGNPVFTNTAGADAEARRYGQQLQLQQNQFDQQEKIKSMELKANTDKDNSTATMKEASATFGKDTPAYNEFMKNYVGSKLGSEGSSGGRAAVMNGRIVVSGNEIAKAMNNISQLPVGSSTGLFGNIGQSHSLFEAGANALKSDFTPDQVKDYNAMWTGVARSLGTLETSGLATTGSLISSIDKLSFVPTDNGYNALRKMAEVRQITDAALEPKLIDPSLTVEQKGFIKGIIDSMANAVPFTHQDLTNFKYRQQQNPDMTFSDYAKKNNLGTSDQNIKSPVQNNNKPSLSQIFGQ